MSEGVETEAENHVNIASKLCDALFAAAEAIGAKEGVDDAWMAMAACAVLNGYLTGLPMHDALRVLALQASMSKIFFENKRDVVASEMGEDSDDADDVDPARHDA